MLEERLIKVKDHPEAEIVAPSGIRPLDVRQHFSSPWGDLPTPVFQKTRDMAKRVENLALVSRTL